MGSGNGSLTKLELARRINEEIGFPVRSGKKLVDAVFNHMTDILISGEPLKIVRFGTFCPLFKNARKGINPSTGEDIIIPARDTVSFWPSPLLKKMINAEKRPEILPDRGSQQDSGG